jgi:salicylate hydroxylase
VYEKLKVAVLGGGIAGLTVAAALSRDGVHCDVFEQTRQLSEVGAGVQVAPNASRLLHRLGLRRRLGITALTIDAIELRTGHDDRLVRRTGLGDRCESLFDGPYCTVHRADLHQGLLDLLPPGTVHLTSRCVGVEERNGRARAWFDDGSSTDADLIVGADGIHSVVRENLVADKPKFSGQAIYRGLVPAELLDFPAGEPKVRLWLGPDRHCVCYPVSGGRQFSFGATIPASTWHAESWSAAGSVADLTAAYQDWHPTVRRIVGAAGSVGVWALHDRDTVPRWSTDHVTLAGDAAHPMLPFMAQGANQAIEDAFTLVACLRRYRGEDVPAALRHYQDLRKPRTDQIQQMSRGNTKKLHLDDSPGHQREGGGHTTEDVTESAWLYGYDAEAVVAA